MFARYFVELPLPVGDVEEAVLRDPQAWIPGLARAAEARGEALMVEVGFGPPGHRVEKLVRVEIGEVQRFPGKTLLPLRWRPEGLERLVPALDADLEIAGLGAGRTQLAVSASYRPPLGLVGRAMDRALLHRVAEATIKDFVDGVAGRVAELLPVAPGGVLGA
jgi:hypothetical protein